MNHNEKYTARGDTPSGAYLGAPMIDGSADVTWLGMSANFVVAVGEFCAHELSKHESAPEARSFPMRPEH